MAFASININFFSTQSHLKVFKSCFLDVLVPELLNNYSKVVLCKSITSELWVTFVFFKGTIEDGDSDSISECSGNKRQTISAMTGIHEAVQDVLEEGHSKVEDQAVGRRHSWIWSHFELLDDLAAVRCRICSRTLQDNGGTSNLHRHMSKKHPQLCQIRLSHSSTKRPMPGNAQIKKNINLYS